MTLREEHIAGQAGPDSFLRGRTAGLPLTRGGVRGRPVRGAAGRAGNFAVVVGINRRAGRPAAQLRRHGADVVVPISPAELPWA